MSNDNIGFKDHTKKPELNLDIHLSYPDNPDYEYETRLVRLNLDKERENDILHDKGFIVEPTQGIKKDIKSDYSIFSSKFGRSLKDLNATGNRFKCKCGYKHDSINRGVKCPICGSLVEYVDDDYSYFGYAVLNNYYIINPAFYKAIEFYIGKDFKKILKMVRIVDEDGHQHMPEKEKSAPYNGIGMVKFYNQFDEIMEFYCQKNKGNKQAYYDDIMGGREKVFTQSIPIFTSLLRPFDEQTKTFSFESTNAKYYAITKLISTLNQHDVEDDGTNTSGDVRKYIDQMLFQLQKKEMSLVDDIVEILSGKKGSIRNLFGGRYNFSTRNVITANPKLRIDEVTLPYSALIELLKGSIINILTKSYSMSPYEAYNVWYKANIKKNPIIERIILKIIHESTEMGRGLPVIINRNPTINFGSILQCFCVGISDMGEKFQYVMQVPLQILPLLAADFDGDVLNLFYIINRNFFLRAYEVFNPRNNQYISHNDGMFNNDVNHQRDTLINATSMLDLGRINYSQDELNLLMQIKKNNEQLYGL